MLNIIRHRREGNAILEADWLKLIKLYKGRAKKICKYMYNCKDYVNIPYI